MTIGITIRTSLVVIPMMSIKVAIITTHVILLVFPMMSRLGVCVGNTEASMITNSHRLNILTLQDSAPSVARKLCLLKP